MIVNLRGNSGSGKSYVAGRLLEVPGWTLDVGPELTAVALRSRARSAREVVRGHLHLTSAVAIVGSYATGPGGGCDRIRTQDEVEARVRHYAALGFKVFFEGLLISGLWSRWPALDDALTSAGRGPYVWAYLETPLEECLDRIRRRRRAVGNEAPLDEQNTRNRVRSIERSRQRAEAQRRDVRGLLSDENGVAAVTRWLGLI